MRTIKTRYVMPLVILLSLPSVLLIFVPSVGLFTAALGIAALVKNLIADRNEDNPLYEDEAEAQNCVSDELNEKTVIVPCYLWAR